MTQVWPVGITQACEQGGYSEQNEENTIKFQPEVDESMMRERYSFSAVVISFEIVLTFDDWDTLNAFWRTTCKSGTQEFTRKHPRNLSGSDMTWKFVQPPAMSAISGGYNRCRVNVTMRNMP